MRNFSPYLLVLLGLVIAFVATLLGYTHGSIHADSTLEMFVQQNAQLKKYNLIALIGLIACITGIFWIGMRVLVRRRKRKSQLQ